MYIDALVVKKQGYICLLYVVFLGAV